MKDKFNLKIKDKNGIVNITNTKTSKQKGICFDTDNQKGICSWIIVPGIDVGWIWKDINTYSRYIMNIINGQSLVNTEDNPATTKPDNYLENLELMQEKFQGYIFKTTFIILFLIVCISFICKHDETNGFFGITNKCYFIQDLIKHGTFSLKSDDKKYNFSYILIIIVLAMIFFILPAIVKSAKDNSVNQENKFFGLIFIVYLFIILGLGWIILGNVLFTEKSVIMISVIFVSTIIICIVSKSSTYYNVIQNTLGNTIDEDTQNKNKWLSTFIILTIIIINIVIISYISIKNLKLIINTKDSVQNIDSSKYEDLTDYLNKEILGDLSIQQNKILDKIQELHTELEKLEAIPDEVDISKVESLYEYYLDKLLQSLKSKDEWYKEICKLYKLKNGQMESIGKKSVLSNLNDDISKSVIEKIWKEPKTKDTFIKEFSKFTRTENYIHNDWIIPKIIKDLFLGGVLRIVEIFNITIGNAFNVVLNIFKTILHFLVHSFEDKDLIKKLSDMNLFNFWQYDILSTSHFSLAHKRIAKMYDLFIQLS